MILTVNPIVVIENRAFFSHLNYGMGDQND